MSIQFGGSKSKEKSSSTMQQASDFNRTDMPVVPDWISSGVQGLGSKIGNFFASTDPAQLVAGLDPLQTQAAGAAQALTPRAGAYDEAANITRGITGMGAPRVEAASMGSASLLDNLGAYMSPYTGQVVDAALADFDFGAGETRAQQALDMAGAGAFGGSGAALTRAATEDALTRGRASTSASLRDQGFRVGADLSGQDAGRRQQAAAQNAMFQQQAAMANAQAEADNRNRALGGAGQIANLASQIGGDERAIIGTQAAMGDVMRGVWQDQVSAPVDVLAQQLALYTGLPLEMFVGATSQGRENTTGSGTGTGSGSQFGFGLGYQSKSQRGGN